MKKKVIIIASAFVLICICAVAAVLIGFGGGEYNVDTGKKPYELDSSDLVKIESEEERMGAAAKTVLDDKTKLATVNGLPIYQIDIEQKRHEVSLIKITGANNGTDYQNIDLNNDKQLLNAVIEDKVFLSEAANKGIDIPLEQVYEELKEHTIASKHSLDESDGIPEQLKKENETFWTVMDAYKKGLGMDDEEFLRFYAVYERTYRIKLEVNMEYSKDLIEQNLSLEEGGKKIEAYKDELMKKADIVYY